MTEKRWQPSENEKRIIDFYTEEKSLRGERGAIARAAARAYPSSDNPESKVNYCGKTIKKYNDHKDELELHVATEGYMEVAQKLNDMRWQLQKKSELIDKLEEDETKLVEFLQMATETLTRLDLRLDGIDALYDEDESPEGKAIKNEIRAISRMLSSKYSPLQFLPGVNLHKDILLSVDKIIGSWNDAVFTMRKLQDILLDADPALLPLSRQIELAEWFEKDFCSRCKGLPYKQEQLDEMVVNAEETE